MEHASLVHRPVYIQQISQHTAQKQRRVSGLSGSAPPAKRNSCLCNAIDLRLATYQLTRVANSCCSCKGIPPTWYSSIYHVNAKGSYFFDVRRTTTTRGGNMAADQAPPRKVPRYASEPRQGKGWGGRRIHPSGDEPFDRSVPAALRCCGQSRCAEPVGDTSMPYVPISYACSRNLNFKIEHLRQQNSIYSSICVLCVVFTLNRSYTRTYVPGTSSNMYHIIDTYLVHTYINLRASPLSAGNANAMISTTVVPVSTASRKHTGW